MKSPPEASHRAMPTDRLAPRWEWTIDHGAEFAIGYQLAVCDCLSGSSASTSTLPRLAKAWLHTPPGSSRRAASRERAGRRWRGGRYARVIRRLPQRRIPGNLHR
jgi:hypothetical protein